MSMETIYIDSLFLINLIINYFILLATAKISDFAFKRLRYLASGAVGAAYAVAAIALPEISFLAGWIMKLAVAAGMCLIAFGGEPKLLRSMLTFFIVSAAFGGAVYAATLLAGGSVGDSLYIPLSMKVLVLSFGACYAVLSVIFRRRAAAAKRAILTVELEFLGRKTDFRALRDTGNDLHDPISGCRVMVTEPEVVLRVLPPGADDCLCRSAAETFEKLSSLEGLKGRLRLIPYTSVGVDMSLLPAFRPDSLTIDGAQEKDVLIAISPTRISETSEYCAIV